MSTRTFLFLGYSFDDPDLRDLLIEIGNQLKNEYHTNKNAGSGEEKFLRSHFAIVPFSELENMASRDALEDAGIQLIGMDLEPTARDGDEYRALWQFLSQIPEKCDLDLAAGHMERTFFLTKHRPAYLRTQNRYERDTTSFRFLTSALTNALTTPDYLATKVAQSLDVFKGVNGINDWSVWKREVLAAMKARADTFDLQLKAGAEFRILCEKTKTLFEIGNGDSTTLGRYEYLLELLGRESADVELRLYDKLEDSVSLSSFASLIRPKLGSSDIGVAYATQATTTEFITHIFEMNSVFATEMLVLFEKEWARAQTEEVSRQLIERALDVRKAQV